MLLKKETECKNSHTCALQHLALSKRVASVRIQLSVVLPVLPGGKLGKTGVRGALEPIYRRQVLLVGHARHAGYVVVAAKTQRVLLCLRSIHQIVDLHHWQPIVVLVGKQGMACT